MTDYETWTDDALVAEVARRMPQEGQVCWRVGAGNKMAYYSHSDGYKWLLWIPLRDDNHLAYLKREIERREWRWDANWNRLAAKYFVLVDSSVGDIVRGVADTESRAWLIAFLRADDAGKEASGE